MISLIHGEPRVLADIELVADVGEVVDPQPDVVTFCALIGASDKG